MTQFILLICVLICLLLTPGSRALATAKPAPHAWAQEMLGIKLKKDATTDTLVRSNSHREVVVAAIDTGADLDHPDLQDHIWNNPGETGTDGRGRDRASNGIDDDGNGFIDDVHGWNFADENKDLRDLNGHGSHIAGIISQVAPSTRLMILKYYEPSRAGQDSIAATVQAIDYATKMGVNIINYSAGGTSPNDDEREAIRRARERGILVVAAAGNEGANSDLHRYYPAGYGLDNIISVSALDANGHRLPSSNYGVTSVHLAAPGKLIWSALPGGRRGEMTGTSQATAFISGLAARLLHEEDLTPKQCLARLAGSGHQAPSMKNAMLIKGLDKTTLNLERIDAAFFSNTDFVEQRLPSGH